MLISWETSLRRGDVKVMELVAGLGSDWHVGALFSFPVPVGAHALALPRAAKPESTDNMEKTLVDHYKFSPIWGFTA